MKFRERDFNERFPQTSESVNLWEALYKLKTLA